MNTDAKVPTDELKSNGGRQTQDDANGTESPRSLLFSLPYMEGVSGGFGENMWQGILLMLHAIELDAEILLCQSTTAGKGGTKRTAPLVMLAVNKDGADSLALTQVFQYLSSIFSKQMDARLSQLASTGCGAGSQATWECGIVNAAAEEVIREAIEKYCSFHRILTMPFNQAVWCRVGKTGAVERAVVDLSNERDSIQFRTVEKKKTKKKRARRRSIPGGAPRYIPMWGRTL